MAKSTGTNPWLKIWVEPRKTIRSIVNTNSRYGLVALCAIYGLPLALNLAQSFALVEVIPVWAVLAGALIVSAFLGIVGISISAWLLSFTGRWIGGKGKFEHVRAAVAWSNVPNFVTILMWVALFGVFGMQVLNRNFSEMQFVGYQAGTLFLVMLVESIVSVWGFIILLNTLAEVQGFSLWRALINVIIPFVALVVIIWGLGWLMSGMGTIQN